MVNIVFGILHIICELGVFYLLFTQHPSYNKYTTPGKHKIYIGIPAYLSVITNCYILYSTLGISRWGAFSSSVPWFGLVYGFLSNNIAYTDTTVGEVQLKVLEVLEVLTLCMIYAISDYYHTQRINFEDYTILIGVGLPMCIIGHAIGTLGSKVNNYPQPEARRTRRSIVLWWFIAVGHGVSSYMWGQESGDMMFSVAHIISALVFAYIISLMNFQWTNVFLQYMVSCTTFTIVAIMGSSDTKVMIKGACLTQLAMAQLSCWLWVLFRS